MLYPAGQVWQPRGDALRAFCGAVDTPALPAADRSGDGRLERDLAAGHVADDIVGEMPTDAAVQKIADADHLVFAVGADGFGDQARGERPDLRAVAVTLRADGQGAEEAVILVAAGQDSGGANDTVGRVRLNGAF